MQLLEAPAHCTRVVIGCWKRGENIDWCTGFTSIRIHRATMRTISSPRSSVLNGAHDSSIRGPIIVERGKGDNNMESRE